MWFRSELTPPKSPPAGLLRVEALEDRTVPSCYLETDPAGDFLPTYKGPHDPGLDVLSYEAVLVGDHIVFAGEMAGPIAPTQAIGGLYIIGVDRGQGTPRFTANTPVIGPNVLWDSVVRVNPDGTGLFNNILTGAKTAIEVTVDGNEFTARVPVSVMQPAATRPPEEWTYNLWPRNSAVIGNNLAVPDLAPDDGNAPVWVVAPAQVAGVAVNDGSDQRSMVNSLAVTFDGCVTIDAGAFELVRDDGSPVEVSVDASEVDGRTVAVLTFTGADVVGGSLADGSYTLTVRGDSVHDRWGRELDGDADGSAGGDRADAFHRLFGDSDGDNDVDWVDRDRFRSSFESSDPGAYLWYFDFDGDGDVDGSDNGQFNRRFGQH